MRWLVNLTLSCLRFFVFIVARFFPTLLIASKIGIDLFGLWLRVFAVLRIFRLFDPGFATAAVEFMGELTGSDDRERGKEILATVLVSYSALGMAWGSAQLQPGDDFPRIIVAGAAALATFLAFAALPLNADERAVAATKITRMWRDSAA